MSKYLRFLRRLFELLIVILIVLLANRRAWYCFFILDNQDYYCLYGSDETDFTWWGIIVVGVVLLLLQKSLLNEYIARWKASWPLLTFILYSVLSLAWTVNLARSIHTIYILIASSIAAAALGTMYSREQIFKGLLWFAGLTALASLASVILFPQVTITEVYYLAGTWRGVFTHKNYLGSVMAFGNGLFLFYVLQARGHLRVFLLGAGFYLLTLFLIIMSQSATGLILFLFLNGLCLAYFAWRRWGNRLQARHYLSIAAALTVASGVVAVNLEWLLSLIGKRASLTGRVPLWQYLVRDIVSKRPWLGYGWETLWYEREFQAASGIAAAWGIIVVNGHSGFMDILLYLGIVGLAIILLVIMQGLAHALRCAWNTESAYSFVPLLILVYVLITNITISYILEFESFHWVLFVLMLFMTTASANRVMKESLETRENEEFA